MSGINDIIQGRSTERITKLMGFGFSKTDAQVYINLLKNGRASGYKISKDTSIYRSFVYELRGISTIHELNNVL